MFTKKMSIKPRLIALGLAGVVAAGAIVAVVATSFGPRLVEPAPSRDWSRPTSAVAEAPAGEPASAPTPQAARKKERPTTRPRPLIAVDGKRLMLAGEPAFLAGVVYPGRSNQDFGDGGWGHAGASNATTTAEIDADFANMAAQGVRVVKWNVFDDGRYSPEFDRSGAVTGLDDKFLDDLDAAIDLAERHDLYLVLSLLSDRFWTTDETTNGVALGGHAATLTDPALRASLVERAIVPMLKHLAFTDRVLAYEIVSLPEYGARELNKDDDGRIRIPLADVQALVKDVAAAVHANTVALATVESNRASHMKQWRGLGLDYYSFQWQDWVEPYEPLGTDAARYELDRPIVAGVPAAGSTRYKLADALELLGQRGYGGAFAASYVMPTGAGSWDEAAPAFTAWARSHWGEMKLAQRQPPAGAVAAKPLPFTLKDARFSTTKDMLTADLRVAIEQTGSYAIQLLCFEEGEKDPVALNDRVGLFQQGDEQDLRLRVFLDDLKEGRIYKISVGLFSTDRGDWKLTKWFDRVAMLSVQAGQARVLTGAEMEQALKRVQQQPGKAKTQQPSDWFRLPGATP